MFALFASPYHQFLKCALLAILVSGTTSIYAPGIAPNEFKENQTIEIKAVKMTSEHYQLPYAYYSLPFCKPKDNNFVYKSENIGEILRGDRIVNTPYDVQMKRNISCRILCKSIQKPKHWSIEDSREVITRIQEEYFIHLLVDNLPVATKLVNLDDNSVQYEHGYRLGYYDKDVPYINNHLNITLFYHKYSKDLYRVVKFEVKPISVSLNDIKVNSDETCMIKKRTEGQEVNSNTGTKLLFSYSVQWQESDIVWASRWDIFLEMKNVQIHWLMIVNSLVMILLLSGVIALILMRTLRRDIARYNSELNFEEVLEETGWKLIHGDVFRPPVKAKLFVAIIGSGIHLLMMTIVTMIFAVLGTFSPAARGALMTMAITLYIVSGIVPGYYSARFYKTFKGREWKRAAFLTASLYPMAVFVVIFVLNLFIWNKKSSGAVPFSTILEVFLLWFFISLPMVYTGFYFGYRKLSFQHPVRTNQIQRQIPVQKWCFHPIVSALIAGTIPFAEVFIELFFILTAIWKNQFYYMFGFLFLVFCVLIISCSQISIAMIYFQLCEENYNWWWQSLIISGGSSIYVALYAAFYFFTKLEINEFIPTLFYFSYTSIMVFTYWLLTSTVGFLSTYLFVKTIYSSVKID